MGGSVILSLLTVDIQALARARHSAWKGSGIFKRAVCSYLFSNSFYSKQKRLCDVQNKSLGICLRSGKLNLGMHHMKLHRGKKVGADYSLPHTL